MGREKPASAMRLVHAACLILLTLVLSGCATNPTSNADASSPAANIACPAGAAVTGFNGAGAPQCAPTLRAQECPSGQFVRGIDASGAIECAPLPGASTGREATQEVASNLRVTGVYGVRNDTAHNLWDLKINTELSAGALPLDVTKLVIRYGDGATTTNYAQIPYALPDGFTHQPYFNATWIRGTGANFVMQSGDLVQLHFNLGNELAPRAAVAVSLIPETGSPVSADFKTPATYSTDTVITLR